ncbi:hypothetical protein SAMN04487918_105110 [Bacillus sp. bc15]|uniref:hypothetical protein n=1 Tax=Bacillus thuringiensis TaxID=1428 RepID=UPI000922B67D|nr:hypothetical protein SAMN04487918_105110 [Bacillus sp. bc15]
MGSKKRKQKQAKRQKYIKKKQEQNIPFSQKSSHYDRKNIPVYLYGSVCNFVYVFIWSVLQFWDNSQYY